MRVGCWMLFWVLVGCDDPAEDTWLRRYDDRIAVASAARSAARTPAVARDDLRAVPALPQLIVTAGALTLDTTVQAGPRAFPADGTTQTREDALPRAPRTLELATLARDVSLPSLVVRADADAEALVVLRALDELARGGTGEAWIVVTTAGGERAFRLALRAFTAHDAETYERTDDAGDALDVRLDPDVVVVRRGCQHGPTCVREAGLWHASTILDPTVTSAPGSLEACASHLQAREDGATTFVRASEHTTWSDAAGLLAALDAAGAGPVVVSRAFPTEIDPGLDDRRPCPEEEAGLALLLAPDPASDVLAGAPDAGP